VDEFFPATGAGLLCHTFASAPSTISLTFTAQIGQWRKQKYEVQFCGVSLRSGELGGPAWPHEAHVKVNGKQCIKVEPPPHLHHRREQCYNLTQHIRQGSNTLEMRCMPDPEKPRDGERFCVGVVLTSPLTVNTMIGQIRSRGMEPESWGQERVERLIAEAVNREQAQDDCMVSGNFGKVLQPLCPVSRCPIEECAVGRLCSHLQVFDLNSYVAVNHGMRSLDKRWTCPVCSLPLRPDEVVVDLFTQGILDTLKGKEEDVEAVVFDDAGGWSIVSATKEDPAGGDGGDKPEACNIDLSDSE